MFSVYKCKVSYCKLSLESESHMGALLAIVTKIKGSVMGASRAIMADAKNKIGSSWSLIFER